MGQRGPADIPVTANDIGLWAVLQERWPDLARSLRQWPGEARGLCDRAAQGREELLGRVKALATPQGDEDTLQSFFAAPEVGRMARVLPKLVSFDAEAHLDPDWGQAKARLVDAAQAKEAKEEKGGNGASHLAPLQVDLKARVPAALPR